MVKIYAGDPDRIDAQFLDVLKSFPDEYQVFGGFSIAGRDIDFLVTKSVPEEQILNRRSPLILLKLCRLSGIVSGPDENAPWSLRDDSGRLRPIELPSGDINYHWDAVNTANTLQEFMWVNQRDYLERTADEPEENFRIWPDVLLLGPTGGRHLLPRKPSKYGFWFFSEESWLRHIEGWDPYRASFGIGLTTSELGRLAQLLGLSLIWPSQVGHRVTPSKDQEGTRGESDRLAERVDALEQRLVELVVALQEKVNGLEREVSLLRGVLNGGAQEPGGTSVAPWSGEILGAQPYVICTLPRQGDDAAFWLTAIGTLADLVRKCVEVESPVHEELAMRRVAGSFGRRKLGSRIRGRLAEAIDLATERGDFVRREDGFLWKRGMTRPPIRSSDAADREISQVAPEEVRAAVRGLVQAASGIGRDQAVQALVRFFGYRRSSAEVRGVVSSAIDSLVGDGELLERRGQLSPPG